jgi:lysophospholipase-3
MRWAALLLVPVVAAILSKQVTLRSGLPLTLPPVVVVPGYASNELDACLIELYHMSSSPRCATCKGQGWFRFYLNHTALKDPAELCCFAEQMSVAYDTASSGDYRNVPAWRPASPT